MVRFERFTDDTLTTLAGAINASVTSITVNDGSGMPTEGDFRIKIGSEIMLVTARATDVLTVQRGIDGTTAASHSSSDGVRLIMTAAQLKAAIDQIYVGGTRHPPHVIQNGSGVNLTASSFTWVNQGTAAVADTTYNGLNYTVPANANSLQVRSSVISTPSTPWVATYFLTHGHNFIRSSWDFFGPIIRDSITGQLVLLRITCGGTVLIQRYATPTGAATNIGATSNLVRSPFHWFQIEDDGTDVHMRTSANGSQWYALASFGRTVHLTNGPNQVGFGMNGGASGGFSFHCSSFTFASPKREQLVNNATTTLNGGINASVTTVTVNDGSVFPSTGNFRALIDSELVKVTARSTNDLTVERGAEGTTAATHSTGANITAVLTAGSLKQYLSEAAPFIPCNTPTRLQNKSGTILTSSDFTWDNQGSASAVNDSYGAITLKAPANASVHSLRMLHKSTPAAPNKTRAFICAGPGIDLSTADGTRFGFGFRESSTGKIFAIEFQCAERNTTRGQLRCMKYTNSTTLSSAVVTKDNIHDRMWLEIEDNNTNLIFRASTDGDSWFQLHSEARTTFMAGSGPNQHGFYINPYNAQTPGAWMHLMAWWEE